jgi:hypothetical protein
MPKHKYAQSKEWNKWPKLENAWYIYGLHLDGESEIRYVGSTRNPQHRFYSHIHTQLVSTKKWLHGKEDRLRIKIFEVANEDPRGRERLIATQLFIQGHRILNIRRPRRMNKTEKEAVLRRRLMPVDIIPDSD